MALDSIALGRWERVRSGLLIGLLIAAFILLLWSANWFKQTQLRLSGLYYLPSTPPDNIVIIGLDDKSLEAYGRSPLGWSRSLYADLVTQVSKAGARVVAFDILFAQPSPDDPILADAIRAARDSDSRTRTIMPIVGIESYIGTGSDHPSTYFQQVLLPTGVLADAVDRLGYVNSFLDVDDIARRQMSFVTTETHPGMAFSLAAYLAYLRIPTAAIPSVVTTSDGLLRVGSALPIAIDDSGLWLQNYFSGDENQFLMYSLRDVLNGNVPSTVFNDKLVLVGLTTTGATDRFPTPAGLGGRLMPGVEINANAIATLMSGSALQEQSRVSQVAMIVILSLIASLIYTQLRWQWALVVFGLLLGGWFVTVFVSFGFNRIIVNLFHSTLALALPLLISIGANITNEITRRQRLEFLLESVVQVSNQQLDMNRILPQVLRDIQKTLKAPKVAIWIWDKAHTERNFKYYLGVDTLEEIRFNALVERLKNTVTATVISEDRTLAVPLVWRSQLIGAIAAESSSQRARVAIHKLLPVLGQQIAPTLASVLLHIETEQQREQLAGILGGSPAAIFIVDKKFLIRRSNEASDKTFGLTLADFQNVPLMDLLKAGGADDKSRTAIQQGLQQVKPFWQVVKLGKHTYNLDAAPLTTHAEWVLVLSDISTLAELNDLKSRMIRMASHDLKNPLSRIIGYVYLMVSGEEQISEENQKYLGIVNNAANDMNVIIEEVLNLEQLQAGIKELVPLDVTEVVQGVVDRQTPDAIRKTQTLQAELPTGLPQVAGSAFQLTQAVTNLVGNAIKYTPDGGIIQVRLSQKEQVLRLEIEDNGYGISEAGQVKLFEPFYRVRTDATANISGTGLGLSMVKTIIEAHGGRIWIKSAEGVGSTFFLELPITYSK